jgi:hypothetical protein
LRRLTAIDHQDHDATVALDEAGEEALGVARYVRDHERPDMAGSPGARLARRPSADLFDDGGQHRSLFWGGRDMHTLLRRRAPVPIPSLPTIGFQRAGRPTSAT